ncbi:MAG: glycine--tRNA ligase [Deltaproteobacteria bacterium]|nr:glycine--tRNA ligase [Deltaproteobacteria bacterium]
MSELQKSMDEIVALCKRRGFIYPASEIYGGINGFWDFGPLGTQLKNNIRDLWWRDTVLCPPIGPEGEILSMVGVDTSIIQNPRVWEASGHVGGFNDPMVDCRESKNRYRHDHLQVLRHRSDESIPMFAFLEGEPEPAYRKIKKQHKLSPEEFTAVPLTEIPLSYLERVIGPDTDKKGTLTEPRQFNLMFKTYVGAVQDEDAVAYLRPETAQGIFLNFKSVLDTMRVKVPFGIAQIGRAFRNEVTPRNYIFRSREFEQMEIEWFCQPDQAKKWYDFWCEHRKNWWQAVGLKGANLNLRSHGKEELAHYAKEGCGTFDIEYRFPFSAPGFGELEGVAHRTDFDLRQHQQYSRAKLEYFDPDNQERYFPHVIEPSAGLSRGVLALICEAFTTDPERPSKMFMKFNPRIAPITAGIFPLVNKEGMAEIAEKLYQELRCRYAVQFDVKQTVGKRYARMDEAGTPFCFTVDSQTLQDQTVTVRYRDTTQQERVNIDKVASFLQDHLA